MQPLNQKTVSALALCLSTTLLAGCGGGGGGGQPQEPDQNAGNTNLPTVILPGPIPPNSPTAPTGDTDAMSLAMPPRQQWEVNWGYCGEVSFITAGLYYGQYVSQYDARSAATPGVAQSRVDSQLLIGVNDLTAASNMHLNAVEWSSQASSSSTDQFLAWAKGYVLAGYPVIIGIYVNQFAPGTPAGSSEYDHIVPVNGIASNHPLVPGLDQPYYADDVLQFSDNSGYNHADYPDLGGNPPLAYFLFQYGFDAFQRTRVAANADDAPKYSLASHVDGGTENAGVAITGVIDLDNETVPVRLATDRNDESPPITDGSNLRPPSEPLTLTATVFGLTAGASYKVYEYDSLAAIPNSAFNAHASAAVKTFAFTATDSTYVLPAMGILSNQVAAFRAVPASAP